MTGAWRLACLVTMVLFAGGSALARADDTAPVRSSSLAFVQAIKKIVDARALSSKTTYTTANLQRRFGADVPIVEIVREDQDWRLEFQSGEGRVPPMLFVTMDRHRPAYLPAGAQPECRVGLVVREASPDLAFDRIVEALGPGWRRDPGIERERAFDVRRQKLAGPYPKATVPMGNATIVYGVPQGWLRLDFGPSGLLERMLSQQIPC